LQNDPLARKVTFLYTPTSYIIHEKSYKTRWPGVCCTISILAAHTYNGTLPLYAMPPKGKEGALFEREK